MRTQYDDERLIVGTAAEVWAVVADPVVLAALDDRLALESTEGAIGTVGSAWAMRLRVGGRELRLGAVVTDAVEGERLAYDAFINGRPVGGQAGTVEPGEGRTLLRWSVTSVHPWAIPGFLVRRMGRRELRNWLGSVEQAVAARRGQPQAP